MNTTIEEERMAAEEERRAKQNAIYLRDNGEDPNGKGFVWGRVVATHAIGNVAVVEYRKERPINVSADVWMKTDPNIGFHLFVKPVDDMIVKHGEWYDTAHGFATLDEAVIAGIVFHHLWMAEGLMVALNTHLAKYVLRMVDGERS